jgi:hypothetical protein
VVVPAETVRAEVVPVGVAPVAAEVVPVGVVPVGVVVKAAPVPPVLRKIQKTPKSRVSKYKELSLRTCPMPPSVSNWNRDMRFWHMFRERFG